MAKATPFRDEIKKRFYPFAEKRGFVRQKSTNPHFTEFRRDAEGRIDTFDIQWDKYGRPRFVLNFDLPTDEGRKTVLSSGRLQRFQGGDLWCWFGSSRPWLGKLRALKWSYTPAEVVDELIAAFDELEEWWSERKVGPHIRIV